MLDKQVIFELLDKLARFDFMLKKFSVFLMHSLSLIFLDCSNSLGASISDGGSRVVAARVFEYCACV